MEPTSSSSGILRITRSSQWANAARKIRIFVDGQEVGAVGHGKSIELPLPSGSHDVEATLDWCRTPRVPVQIDRGATVELALGCNLGFLAFDALWRVLFAPSTYLYLRPPTAAQ